MSDITTILSGIEPAQNHFEVTDTDSALWCVGHITKANTKRAAIEAQYKEWKAKLDAWKDGELKEIERTEEHMISLIQPWAAREIAKGRDKHIDLPGARIGYRSTPAKVVVNDEETALEYLRKNHPECVRTKQEVDKEALKKVLESTLPGAVPGVNLDSGWNRFYVKER